MSQRRPTRAEIEAWVKSPKGRRAIVAADREGERRRKALQRERDSHARVMNEVRRKFPRWAKQR